MSTGTLASHTLGNSSLASLIMRLMADQNIKVHPEHIQDVNH